MSYDRTFSIMLSVGMVSIYVGIVLSTITRVDYYYDTFAFKAYDFIIYPYLAGGVIMILTGIGVLVTALIRIRRKKTVLVTRRPQKTELQAS